MRNEDCLNLNWPKRQHWGSIPVVFPLQDETFLLQLKNIKSWATSRNEQKQGLRSWCQSKLFRRQSAKVNLVNKQNDYSSELQQKHRQHFFVFWKEERDVITVETKVSQTIMYFFSGVTIWVFECYETFSYSPWQKLVRRFWSVRRYLKVTLFGSHASKCLRNPSPAHPAHCHAHPPMCLN